MSDEDKLDKFDRAVDAAEKPFFALFDKQEKNSRRITMMAFVVGFDVLMFLCFGYVALRADHAVDAAEKARIAQVTNQCESGNEFRRLDLQRWNYILKVASTPDPDASSAQRTKTAKENELFRKYVEQADKQRDCKKFVEDQLKLEKK